MKKFKVLIAMGFAMLYFSNSNAQSTTPAFPKITGYFSVLVPVTTYSKGGFTSTFDNGYTLAFPFGINIIKNDKFGVSFEFTPVMRTQNGVTKVSAVLFNPGALFKFSNGFSYTQRIGFETSGRFGFSAVFNKVLLKRKDYGVFTSVPIPFRFGNGAPMSVGAGLLLGVSF